MPAESIAFKGAWRAVRTAPDGTVLSDSGWQPNVVTNYAANAFMQWATGSNNTGYNPVEWPSMLQLGTGSGTPEPTDTNLFAPVAATLQNVSVPGVATPGVGQWITQYYGTSSNAGSYTEGGLKDASGNLWTHSLASIDITESDTTTVTWTITPSV